VRGERLFNEKPLTITGVAGLNDLPNMATVKGSCTTCHDSPNVGDHSVKLPLNIGVVAPTADGLDTDGLPVFTLRCDAGALTGTTFQVTDPGKALISGQCADIGKTKGPVLRDLAARAPYFHNGAASDLEHVVTFYDTRFGIGFTEQEKRDLIALLKSL
jgi:cytochrome c peroxidase